MSHDALSQTILKWLEGTKSIPESVVEETSDSEG